jgi:hypothetical protein
MTLASPYRPLIMVTQFLSTKTILKKYDLMFFDSHGDLPHGHVQYFDGKRWCDYTDVHRIALKDSLD